MSDIASIRGIRFQILRDAKGRAETIIAMRVGAVAPVFKALKPSALIYEAVAEELLVALFRDEEGKQLAATLGVAATTIWGIRVGFGIADKQLGDSKTTQWRKSKTTVTRYSITSPDATEAEEEEEV